MPKQYEDVDYRPGNVLKDGQRMHVDLMMCDALQRAIATDPDVKRVRDDVRAADAKHYGLYPPGPRHS